MIKVFCQFFKNNDFRLTKKEYELLIKHDKIYTNDALAKVAREPQISNLPTYRYDSNEVTVHHLEKKIDIVNLINLENRKKKNKSKI
jgi:hypothetical protein